MVQDLPRSPEGDTQDNRFFNNFLAEKTSNDKTIWPSCKAEADDQRALLNRYSSKDSNKEQLPMLGELAFLQTLESNGSHSRTDLLSATNMESVATAGDHRERDESKAPKHEKVNANGSTLKLNADNTVSELKRKDGSTVDIKYEHGEQSQLIDTNKDATARTVWTQNAAGLWQASSEIKNNSGKWISDGTPSGRLYRDISVNDQGVTTAIDQVGMIHVTAADGARLAAGATYTFDDRGNIASISYGPGAGANRIMKFQYDANNKLDRVDTLNSEGKLQESRRRTGDGQWQITGVDGSATGTWPGQMDVTANGNFRQQEAKDKTAGIWQVTTPSQKYREQDSADGKHISRTYSNGLVLDFARTDNGEERLTKLSRGKNSREFQYDAAGKLCQVVETINNNTKTFDSSNARSTVDPSGEVTFQKPDGTTITKNTDFSTVEQDKDGNIMQVTNKDGMTRSFHYETVDHKEQLVGITESHPVKKGLAGSAVFKARVNGDGHLSGDFVSTAQGGKETVLSGVQVFANGDYIYKGADGKEHTAEMRDSSGGFSADVDQARERLVTALDGQIDAKDKTRLQLFMKELEARSHDAIERETAAGENKDSVTAKWDKKISKTYDELAEMMEQSPSTAVYDKATRAKLAMNFMWICGDTTRGAQDVGNCWEMSGRNLIGMQNNPDQMARMLKEVSLTGTYTSVHGGLKSSDPLDQRGGNLDAPRKFDIPKNMLHIDRVNSGWSLDHPNACYWQGGTGTMPSTPVGYILDNVIGYMGGRTSHAALDGGTWESFNSPDGNTRNGWYYGIGELMYMATGERSSKPVRVASNDISDGDIGNLDSKRLQKQLLEHGGALLNGPGHMFAVKLLKKDNQWEIVADNQWGAGNDQVVGIVKDLRNWDVQSTRQKYVADKVGDDASGLEQSQTSYVQNSSAWGGDESYYNDSGDSSWGYEQAYKSSSQALEHKPPKPEDQHKKHHPEHERHGHYGLAKNGELIWIEDNDFDDYNDYIGDDSDSP